MAGAGAGNANGRGRGYGGSEVYDGDERGWKWGSQSQNNGPRPPLPLTPMQNTATSTLPYTASSQSELNAMMAQSRTGYEPYAHAPQRQNSLTRAASAIYKSLSGRGGRFASNASSRSAYSTASEKGHWNEHGVFEAYEGEEDAQLHQSTLQRAGLQRDTQEDAGQSRPLLACVDETPRKKGFSTYTPQESPTRSGTSLRCRNDDDDTDITIAGASSAGMLQSISDDSPRNIRRFTLKDNPVPALSPAGAKRQRSRTLTESECDSPSVYSPSNFGHSPQPSYPAALQPRMSPAIGSRPVSPAIQSHPYYIAHNKQPSKPSNLNPLLQSTKSGTTYSLSGMAGLLYSEEPQQRQSSSYTSIPPRKPRRQSVLAKTRPVLTSPLSNDATAGDVDEEINPHRAVSRVVKQSRQRGDSFGSGSSESGSGPATSGWNRHVRDQLRESHSSGSSINDLLHNVLGPSRSPA